MGIGFYPHLAWDGIRKNKRLYLPYILTCTGMVMMFYIIAFLAGDTMLKTVRGGSFVTEMLGLGTYVIMIFAVLFRTAPQKSQTAGTTLPAGKRRSSRP